MKASTPIDVLIDKACGVDQHNALVMEEFIQAVYAELWAGEPAAAVAKENHR